MACFNVGFVMPVNTAGASSKLTLQEVWKGCVLLAREPQVYTDAISSCVIKSDEGDRMTRTLAFSVGPVKEMDQDVTLTKNYKFESITLGPGNKVTTTIFHGVTEDIYDLYLSIEYNIPYGSVPSDGPEAEAFQVTYTQRAKQNLVDGVAKMRELKRDGKLV